MAWCCGDILGINLEARDAEIRQPFWPEVEEVHPRPSIARSSLINAGPRS